MPTAAAPPMPTLLIGDQHCHEYESGWLQRSIQQAAERAGHQGWFFAEDIAKAMIHYLRDRFRSPSITVGEVFDKIGVTLSKIGFPEIAAKLQAEPPPFTVSLTAAADDAGAAFELAFYHAVRRRLREVAAAGGTRIAFTGLHKAAMKLCRARRTCQESRSAEAEIVAFIRRAAELAAPADRPIFVVIR